MSETQSDNPLAPLSAEQEQRIRERAYFLWEQAGRPQGGALDYWERARELQAIADHPQAGLRPNPLQDPGSDRVIEEAAIQENLGEFPGRLTDQGERRETPMTRQEELAAMHEG